MGAGWDWEREVVTCLPDYYKWTQWLFLQFYKHGLAYRTKAPANWCPSCNTTLANEQVRPMAPANAAAHVVERREIDQWLLRITNYADELLHFDWHGVAREDAAHADATGSGAARARRFASPPRSKAASD